MMQHLTELFYSTLDLVGGLICMAFLLFGIPYCVALVEAIVR